MLLFSPNWSKVSNISRSLILVRKRGSRRRVSTPLPVLVSCIRRFAWRYVTGPYTFRSTPSLAFVGFARRSCRCPPRDLRSCRAQSVETESSACDDFKLRARGLADEYIIGARKIWCFGPDTTGSISLVGVAEGVQYLNEIEDPCIAVV